MDVFEFQDVAPSREVFLRSLRPYVGLSGIESYRVNGRRIELSCMLDPYTRPYACAILSELGGRFIDDGSGRPGNLRLPWYASLPQNVMPAWARLKIGLGWYRSMFMPPRQPAPGTHPEGEMADDAWYYDTAEARCDPGTGLATVDRIYCLDWDRFTRSHFAALGGLYLRLPGAQQPTGELPCWFGPDEGAPPYLLASIEPPGLQVTGELAVGDWEEWDRRFRELASGFPRKEPQ